MSHPVVRWVVRIVLALVAVVVLLAGGAYAWWKWHTGVETIPTELAAVTATDADKLAALRVPGGDGLPDLRLAEQRGHVSYYVLESRESMEAREGQALSLALDRWRYPADVRGFAIGEAEGLGVLRWQIDKLVKHMRAEARLPLYMDYEGAILRGFHLPKGHTGLVVLGKNGEVLLRKSGAMNDAELAELRTLLGAEEPPAPPVAPTFHVGPLSNATCGAGKACAVVFLARQVRRAEVPFIQDGFIGDADGDARQFADASVRLVAALVEEEVAAGGSAGVFVGDMVDLPPAPGWSVVAPASAEARAARAAFGVGADEAALVIVDDAGRVALRETGRIAMWKFGPLRNLLKLPPPRKRRS